jgi:hypothetical protein
MNQLISKIENSMLVMVIGFYAEYLNAWVKTFESNPINSGQKLNRKNQIKILHTVKA